MIRALLLDLDQTLMYSHDYASSILLTCKDLSERVNVSAEELARANREVWSEHGEAMMRPWTVGELSGRDHGLAIWRRVLARFGIDDPAIASHAAFTLQRLGRETYRLFADARALMDMARKQHLPMAVVTNGASDTQRDKMQALGIESWFDAFAISGEHGVAIPNSTIQRGASHSSAPAS